MTDRVAVEPDPSVSAELHSPEVGAGSADASQVLDGDSNSPQAPAGLRDPEPSDAASGTDELVPRFPLEEPGTWLVLYDSAPGELRARWSLARTDIERFGNSFPVQGSRPEAVLRLRRSRPEGGAELAHEVSLIQVARERSGDVGFRVGPDHCRYHAELGLATGDGGWLMLARSNGLDNAATIGLRLPVSQERRQPLAPNGERAEEPDPYRSRQCSGLVFGAPTGPAAPTHWDGSFAAQLSLQHYLPADASLHPAGPAPPDSPDPYFGLVPRFPLVEPARGWPTGESGGTACVPENPSVLATDGAGLPPESVDAGTSGDALLDIHSQQGSDSVDGSATRPGPRVWASGGRYPFS